MDRASSPEVGDDVRLKFGLRWRALLIVALTATASGGLAWLLTVYRLANSVTQDLEQRGRVVSRALEQSPEIQRSIAATRAAAPPTGIDEEAEAVLQGLIRADPELKYIVVLDQENKPLLRASVDPATVPVRDPAFFLRILDVHLSDASRSEDEAEGGESSLDEDTVTVTEPLHDWTADNQTAPDKSNLSARAAQVDRSETGTSAAQSEREPDRGSTSVTSDAVDAEGPAGVASTRGEEGEQGNASELPTKRRVGTVLIGLSSTAQLHRIAGFVRDGVILSSVLVVVAVWLIFGWLYHRIRRLRAYAHQLAGGDLTQGLDERSSDELGALGRALESITQNLGETISRVRVAAIEMDTMSTHVSDASKDIAANAGTQAQSVQETGLVMGVMSDSSQAVESQILAATNSAEASAERLHQMSGAIEIISSAVNQLAAAVEQSRSYVQKNVESLADIDEVVFRLNEAVEGTATATQEISASIRSVDDSANAAFGMSSDASKQAQSGVEAVSETRDAIQEIRAFTNRAVEWIRFLSEKVASIDQILEVITDIANQTRLLSLNASIIASQAGEHGRGFLVVADQIKALAAKTAGSTREISGVITEVLNVSGKVMDVVEKGVSTVDVATTRSDHANLVLDGILAASTQTGTLIRGIAAAMSEQSRGAQRVNQAMQDVRSTAVVLRDIVASQKRAGTDVQSAMARMREVMARALQTSREQAEQVGDAIIAVGSIFEQIRRIHDANQGQSGSREEVVRAFTLLEQLSDRNQESARSLAAAVERAAAQSSALTESVKVFRV